MNFPDITLSLPPWLQEWLAEDENEYRSDEERMKLAIGLSRRNVLEGTGGPFGAAVFDGRSHRLVAPGVNLVVPQSCSSAHAEVVALSVAQRVLQTHDLGEAGRPEHILVSSTEPCAMCLGAVPWSGVRRLVCGATAEDAEHIGLDEGSKPNDWTGELGRRGIEVILEVRRDEAAQVLVDYARSGGWIYNGRGAPSERS